jgi:hypothetical protein
MHTLEEQMVVNLHFGDIVRKPKKHTYDIALSVRSVQKVFERARQKAGIQI